MKSFVEAAYATDMFNGLVQSAISDGGELPSEVNTAELWTSVFDLLLEMLSNCINNITPDAVLENITAKTPLARIATRRAVRAASREAKRATPPRLQKVQADVALKVMADQPDVILLAASELEKFNFNIFS